MEDEFVEKSRDFMQDYYGHCAVVTQECYGDETVSIIFRKEKRTLYENDFDSLLIVEVGRVQQNLLNTRVHYSSEEQL